MSVWGERPGDFTGEPRKVFINLLIWDIKQIQSIIYLHHSPHAGLLPLMGLIDSLDEKSKKALKEAYGKLEAMHSGRVSVKWGSVEAVFKEVLNYLHTSYLKEVGYAKPRYPHSKLGVPKK